MKIERTRIVVLSSVISAILMLCLFFCNYILAQAVYDSKSFENIYAAISAIGQTKGVLLVTSQNKIQRNLLVPSNITLRFQEDGGFFVENGKTVTIDSPIQAPTSKIIDGEGKVIMKAAEVFPQWWGAKGDGINDDGYAIEAAIESVHAGGGGVLRLPVGIYLLNHISGRYYALKSKDKVSVIGEGNASILKVGDGLRTATRGVAVLYNHDQPVSQCRYANFTVDYNGKANLRQESWGKFKVPGDISRMGAHFASNIVIENISFKDVTGAHCIWLGDLANHHNIIRNCVVFNVGQGFPGNHITDHSSIYIGGTNNVITGNTFYNQIPCNVSAAIEVHCKDTVVLNNTVTNYKAAVNACGEVNDLSNVAIKNNIFRNCANGIIIWHYSPYTMRNLAVSENTISLRETDEAYPPSIGIFYGGGYVTSSTNMSGLYISGNTIYQETLTIPSPKPNSAIFLQSIDDVTISGNTIYNISGEAVFIGLRKEEQGMRGLTMSGNTVRNVGFTSAQRRKRAIALNSFHTQKGSIADVMIKGNVIMGGKESPMLNGITFYGLFPRVNISGNKIQGTASSEIMNNSSDRDSNFYIDHAGRGSPVNVIRASIGSRWVDLTSGRTYTYQPAGWISR